MIRTLAIGIPAAIGTLWIGAQVIYGLLGAFAQAVSN